MMYSIIPVLFLVYLAESVGGGQFTALANQRFWSSSWVDLVLLLHWVNPLPSTTDTTPRTYGIDAYSHSYINISNKPAKTITSSWQNARQKKYPFIP